MFIVLILNFILWLVIGALLLRWIVGGIIDCFKKGIEAPILSWVGFLIGLLGLVIICALG